MQIPVFSLLGEVKIPTPLPPDSGSDKESKKKKRREKYVHTKTHFVVYQALN